MQLSKVTIEILKNMATINPGIIIRPGNRLATMNVLKTVFVNATIPDTFPSEFAIYDLNELLTSISAFENPDIEFNDDHLLIRGEHDEVEYRYSQPNVIVCPGDKNIVLPSVDKSFTLTRVFLERINRFSSIHKLKELKIDCNSITLLNRNGSGNKYKLKLDIECSDKSPSSYFKVENLCFIPMDYKVQISNKRIAQFISNNSDYDISYFITMDLGDD